MSSKLNTAMSKTGMYLVANGTNALMLSAIAE
jgi:hypothetical protein